MILTENNDEGYTHARRIYAGKADSGEAGCAGCAGIHEMLQYLLEPSSIPSEHTFLTRRHRYP